MRLRPNEFCPIHISTSCCGRELMPSPRLIRLGVQRIEDSHHQRGYRELRSPAEMRKLVNLQNSFHTLFYRTCVAASSIKAATSFGLEA